MEITVLKKVRKTVTEEVREKIDVEYPTENRFYRMEDDGNFFPRGTVLFAILIKHSTSFMLYEIERGQQLSTDFVPTKDCRQDSWIAGDGDTGIRRTALSLLIGDNTDFREITKEEFMRTRNELLNSRMEEFL